MSHLSEIGRSGSRFLLFLLFAGALSLPPHTAEAQGRGRMKPLDVPFATTPPAAVNAMLKLAGTGPDDVVMDPGAGDGRIVIAAVLNFGARMGIGIDLDSRRVREATDAARRASVQDRTNFSQGDAFKTDFGTASVLALFMSPRINRELEPRIRAQMRPGSRVVSYRFPVGDWQPAKTVFVGGQPIYLWIVPPPRSP